MIVPQDWQKNVNGREIAVWGTGMDAPTTVTELREANDGVDVSFFVSRDWARNPEFLGKKVLGADVLEKTKHFVVIGTSRFENEIRVELLRMGFTEADDFAAYHEQPYDWHKKWEFSIKDVLVFGTGETASRIAEEARNKGLNVLHFIDSGENGARDGTKECRLEALRLEDERLDGLLDMPVFIAAGDARLALERKKRCADRGFSKIAAMKWERKKYYPPEPRKFDHESVAYEFLARFLPDIPDAEALGESVLSVLQLQDEDGDWNAVKEIVCGSGAQDFLSALADGMDDGTMRKACGACLSYIHAVSRGDVCHKNLEVRLTLSSRVDTYVARAVLERICKACFASSREAQIVFLLLLALEYEDISGYAYATIARLELECGNIESAFDFAKRAEKGGYTRLYMSHLHYDIGIAAKKTGIDINSPVVLDDLRDFFCPFPFETYVVTGFDFASGSAHERVCECGTNSELLVGGGGGWNSRAHRKMREGVLDGSFRFCNRQSCPLILRGALYKKAAITHARTKDIIEKKRTDLSDVRYVVLGYDRHCNLKCPSCRANFEHYSKEQVEVMNRFADANIMPLLKRALTLSLTRSGEALVSPHSLYIISKLSPDEYPNLKIYLPTNGSHDLEVKWHSLGESAKVIKRVHISIDGANRETFEMLRYPAKWETMLKNMNFLSNLKAIGDLETITVNFVMQKENFRQLTELLTLCLPWKITNIRFSRILDLCNQYSEEYRRKAVHLVDHPLHHDYLAEMNRLGMEIERLRKCKVALPNIFFMEKQI